MLNRRQLIIAAARSSVLLSGSFALLACSEESAPTAPILPAAEPGTLDAYAQQMQAISYVGVVCREPLGLSPDLALEQVRLQLEQRLAADLGETGADRGIEQAVDEAIRGDFGAGRIIEIDGWQLAETECRLAALAAAHQGIETAEVPAPPQDRFAEFVTVEAWGPQSTVQGKAFNEQPDGHSGIWIKAAGAPASVVMLFDGKIQGTQVYAEHMTSGLRGEYMQEIINKPGKYTVEIYDKASLTRQLLGEFTVKPVGPPPKVIEAQLAACTIEGWGPQAGSLGEAFNKQPGGASAFWVRTNCALDGSQLFLGGTPLKTTVRENLLTATVPGGHKLPAGAHSLELRVGNADRNLPVGNLVIKP